MNQQIPRSLGIEVKLTSLSTGQLFKFPDNQILRADGVQIEAITAFTASQLAISPGANNVISATGITGLVLQLQDGQSANRVFQHPLYDFNAALNNGWVREFNPFRIVLQNSGVIITDATNLVLNEVAYMTIWYTTPADRASR